MIRNVEFSSRTVIVYIRWVVADELSGHGGHWSDMEQLPVAGINSILSKEHGNKFYNLPIIRYLDKDVGAVAAWDSSVHDSDYLNRVTESMCANIYLNLVLVLVCVFSLRIVHSDTLYSCA